MQTLEMTLPCNPLDYIKDAFDQEARRRSVEGILDSYHSNYDVLSEGVQNAVDAVEDASLEGLPAPYFIEVTISLAGNWISILDTGVGMTEEQVEQAFAPQATFKQQDKRDRKNQYRGYKGVGLTYLAYGADDIILHSKQEGGVLTKARMQYGRAWATGSLPDQPVMTTHDETSPLEDYSRGTYVKIQLSNQTRPKSLRKIASSLPAWNVILRTKTAIGQVLLGREAITPLDVTLKVIDKGEQKAKVIPEFLYPHTVRRSPPFRFLDLVDYHKKHPEQTKPPIDKVRQDGLYLEWDAARITQELSADQRKEFESQIAEFTPVAYAFVPYNGAVWASLNEIETGVARKGHLSPGLMIAVTRQRLADISGIEAKRYETFGRNVFVIVHFDGVKPDQGRKTVAIEAEDFAKAVADRIVQYLGGKQKDLLRPSGESPTPQLREIEKGHADWKYNVKKHAELLPLHVPPLTYVSSPLTEQDVIGLFHQLSALGLFPGIKVYATSQIKTYDCLIEFDCDREQPGLSYVSAEKHPLGLSPYILGTRPKFSTQPLTVEFKNNLDGLMVDIEGESPKSFAHIDICVCWGQVGDSFIGYEIEAISEPNLDLRSYPGITHLLRRDGDTHVIGVIMLQTIIDMIGAGQITFPVSA